MDTSEAEFSKQILNRLEGDFNIYREVWGRHIYTKKNKRIDAVIKPIEYMNWANPDVSFGIEFKKPSSYLDATKVSGLIRQAYDYLYVDFQGFGRMPVLVCPLKIQDLYCDPGEMPFIRRILGKFGIGEIANGHTGQCIKFQNDHIIWSEKYGVQLGKTWKFNFT